MKIEKMERSESESQRMVMSAPSLSFSQSERKKMGGRERRVKSVNEAVVSSISNIYRSGKKQRGEETVAPHKKETIA
jgi:hypothetical protein